MFLGPASLRPHLRAPLLVACLAVSCHVSLSGQDSPQGSSEAPEPKSSAQGDVYKPLGPSIFPLYQHYLRTSDNTTVRNLLYLYTTADNPNGSWARLLVPFFYREHQTAPPKDLF